MPTRTAYSNTSWESSFNQTCGLSAAEFKYWKSINYLALASYHTGTTELTINLTQQLYEKTKRNSNRNGSDLVGVLFRHTQILLVISEINWQQTCINHWTDVGPLDVNQEHEIKAVCNLLLNVTLASEIQKKKKLPVRKTGGVCHKAMRNSAMSLIHTSDPNLIHDIVND